MKNFPHKLLVGFIFICFVGPLCFVALRAPISCLGLFSLFLLFLVYVLLENNELLHGSENRENFVLLGLTSSVFLILFFAPDSIFTLYIVTKIQPHVLLFLSLALPFPIVNNLRTQMKKSRALDAWRKNDVLRKYSNSLLMITDETSSVFALTIDRIGELELVLKELQKLKQSHRIIHFLFARKSLTKEIAGVEEKLLNVFTSQMSPDEMSALVLEAPLQEIFQVFDGSRLISTILDRLDYLNVTARAGIIHCLQSSRFTTFAGAEDFVRRIILSTKSMNLIRMKQLCDSKNSHMSFHHLIFVNITDVKIRDEILEHVLEEAKKMKCISKICRLVKILVDVDDTLESSGGRFPAGTDARFKKHSMYPGVGKFLEQLDSNSVLYSNVVLLSARPHVYRNISEEILLKKFDELRDRNKLHFSPSFLVGNLYSGTHFVMSGNLEPIGARKVENYKQYLQCFPEFSITFFGDTGQADLYVACEMLKHNASAVNSIFLHEVSKRDQAFGFQSILELESNSRKKIYFFQNYLDAAIRAFELSHLDRSQLQEILDCAFEEYENVPWHRTQTEVTKDLDRLNFNVYIERCSEIIGIESRFVESRHIPVPRGTQVKTCYGSGEVTGFSTVSGVYSVSFGNYVVYRHFSKLLQ